MLKRTSCLGGLLVLLAARPALGERMSFRWPVPGKVVVTDKITRGGVSATIGKK
jgi:hypothetical protein